MDTRHEALQLTVDLLGRIATEGTEPLPPEFDHVYDAACAALDGAT